MERFVKINKQVKANLYKICRLCGMDNPNKIGILEEVVFLSDDGEIEPPLYKKIFNCVGIQVTPDDKMPKTVCALCFDKVNDFHEFREMCYVTNVQTRKLLGLSEQPKLELKWEQGEAIIYPLHASLAKTEKKGKKRKIADPPPDNGKKQIKLELCDDPIKSEIKLETELTPSKLSKKMKNKLEKTLKMETKKSKNEKNGKQMKQDCKQFLCNICQISLTSAYLLQTHLSKTHIPTVDRYFCVKCNEKLNVPMQIKSHNLWHKLSKTPYQCGRCDRNINSLQGLTKHTRECPLGSHGKLLNITPNVICRFCSIEFPTTNLFFMHNCITRTLHCPKCKCKLSNQLNTFKHIASCAAKVKNEEELGFVIKTEPPDLGNLDSLTSTNTVPVSKSKNAKNSNQTAQSLSQNCFKENSIAKPDKAMVVIPNTSTVQDYVFNSHELISKNKNDVDITSPVSCSNLIENTDSLSKSKTVVKKHENAMMERCSALLQNTLKTLGNIKQEPIELCTTQFDDENHQNEIDIPIENFPASHIKPEIFDENIKDIESNLEINIKQEIISYPTISQPALPVLKLKIKKEHGTLNSSFIENDDNECSSLDPYKKKKSKTTKRRNKETEQSNTEDDLKSSTEDEIDSSLNKEKSSFNTDAEISNSVKMVKIKTEQIETLDLNGPQEGNDDFDDFESENENEVENLNKNNHETLPIISSVQSCTKPSENHFTNNEEQKESTSFMKISSVISGFDFVKNTDHITCPVKENSGKADLNEKLHSPTHENYHTSLKIVSVSGGFNLSAENVSTSQDKSNSNQVDVASPNTDQISLHLKTEFTCQDSINDLQDFTKIAIKEEPHSSDYFNQLEGNIENDHMDGEKETGTVSFHIKNEYSENYEINRVECELNKIQKDGDIQNIEESHSEQNKLSTLDICNKNSNVIGCQTNENNYSKYSNMEIDSLENEINEGKIISNIEASFDQNIRVKQEIEFTEEMMVEDDQYEYCSDNEDYNDSFSENDNKEEFDPCLKTASPKRELQPIIMNNTDIDTFSIDYEKVSNELNESIKNSPDNSKIFDEKTSFGFKKIKLIMPETVSKINNLPLSLETNCEISNETNMKNIISVLENSSNLNTSLENHLINNSSENVEQILNETVNSEDQTLVSNENIEQILNENVNSDDQTLVSNENVEQILNETVNSEDKTLVSNENVEQILNKNVNSEDQTLVYNENVEQILSETVNSEDQTLVSNENIEQILNENVNSEDQTLSSNENVEQILNETVNSEDQTLSSNENVEQILNETVNSEDQTLSSNENVEQILNETVNSEDQTLSSNENVEQILNETVNSEDQTLVSNENVEQILNETANSEDQTLVSNENVEQISHRLPKLDNINEIAENHNNENFEKMLRNEITQNEINRDEQVPLNISSTNSNEEICTEKDESNSKNE